LDSPPDPEPELDNQAQMMGRTLDARRVDIANAFSNKPYEKKKKKKKSMFAALDEKQSLI